MLRPLFASTLGATPKKPMLRCEKIWSIVPSSELTPRWSLPSNQDSPLPRGRLASSVVHGSKAIDGSGGLQISSSASFRRGSELLHSKDRRESFQEVAPTRVVPIPVRTLDRPPSRAKLGWRPCRTPSRYLTSTSGIGGPSKRLFAITRGTRRVEC